MSLALDRKAVEDILSFVQHREKPSPKLSPSLGMEERMRVSDQNQSVPCAREKDVDTLGGMHKSDDIVRI